MSSATTETVVAISTINADAALTDEVRNGTVTLVLVIIFVAAVILNAAFVAAFARCRELRTPSGYLLVSIAIADILSAFLWILPALVTAATWSWIFGTDFCRFEGFASTLFCGVNTFTLLAVALERFMKFWSPSRHKLAFTKLITLILTSTLWIFSAMFAVIPLVGWANYSYLAPRFNCLMNFGLSYSLLDFYTVAGYGLPLLLSALFFLLIAGKLIAMRMKRNADGQGILEERTDRIGESYGQRFRRQEDKYRNVANKTKKPTFRKSSENSVRPAAGGPDDGRKSPVADPDSDYDLSDDLESDDEDYYTDYVDAIRRRREKERRLRQTRKYRLHRRDVSMTLTVFIVWLIYAALWLPYVILNYVWILQYYPDFGDLTLHTFVMIVALTSTAYKPLIYLCNARMRSITKTRLKKQRTEKRISG